MAVSAHRLDLADRDSTETLFRDGNFGPVVHLAAQASVRYSLQNPYASLDANLAGFLNILEGCRHRKTEHLVYGSSSSVYGTNTQLPFSVHRNSTTRSASTQQPKKRIRRWPSLYITSGIPATGLRFFTVYGPWGRRLIGRPTAKANAAPDAEPDPAKSSVARWRITISANNASD